MKKFGRFAALLCLVVICFCGCGQAKVPETIEASAIAISSKGQVTVYLVGEFDRAYYNLEELASMAREEAAAYNAGKQQGDNTSVVVDGVELLADEKVKLTYRFGNWKAYTEFNEGSLFYGSVSEAAEMGYLTGVSLKSVKDGALMGEEQLKAQGDKKLIVTNAAADIYCPAKVAYVTDGISVNEDGSVAAAGSEGLVCILLK